MLADTTFIIDLKRQDENAVQKAKELSDASLSVLVGTPTIFELYVGVGLSVRASEEKDLSLLKSLPNLPLDASSASKGELSTLNELGKEQRWIRKMPCLRA